MLVENLSVDAEMVKRVCYHTGLPLCVPPEDAIYQLDCFRERYWRDKALAPKLPASKLSNEISIVSNAIQRLLDRFTKEDYEHLRLAIEASCFDLKGDGAAAKVAMETATQPLRLLHQAITHLRKAKEDYEKRGPADQLKFPLQGKSSRKLLPYIRASAKDPVKDWSIERALAEDYLPDLYHFLFGHKFSPNRSKGSEAATYTGPSMRFTLAVFEELQLFDGTLDRIKLSDTIGNAFRNRTKLKVSKAKKR